MKLIELAITPMTPEDASVLQCNYRSEAEEYRQHFTPLSSLSELATSLESARQDRYWTLRVNGRAAGLCFMRGLDEGYGRPSFGVYISSEYSGFGLARAALAHCLAWARLSSIEKVLLKVHEQNDSARRIYESAGFRPCGTCADTGHLMMEKALTT